MVLIWPFSSISLSRSARISAPKFEPLFILAISGAGPLAQSTLKVAPLGSPMADLPTEFMNKGIFLSSTHFSMLSCRSRLLILTPAGILPALSL